MKTSGITGPTINVSKRLARGGFSLIELLVVVAIIGLLVTIMVPTLMRAKELTRRATCAMNLQGLSRAFATYAVENRSFLPEYVGVNNGAWLWDLAFVSRNALIACGATRHMFYCPSGLYQDLDQHWWYVGGVPAPNPSEANTLFSVTGYWWFHRRVPPAATWGPAMNDPKVKASGRKYLVHTQETLDVCVTDGGTTLKTLGPSDLELGADATISTVINGQDYFGHTVGGSAIPHRTSHMNGANQPAGGNMMFLDGHEAWREFVDMFKRASPPDHWW